MDTKNVHEEIRLTNPSDKLMDLVRRMREHKRVNREEARTTKPLFILHA